MKGFKPCVGASLWPSDIRAYCGLVELAASHCPSTFQMKYMNKHNLKIAASATVLLDAERHIREFPSTAEDTGEASRSAKHFTQWVLNRDIIELDSTQAAAIVLGHTSSHCSHAAQFQHPWDVCRLARYFEAGGSFAQQQPLTDDVWLAATTLDSHGADDNSTGHADLGAAPVSGTVGPDIDEPDADDCMFIASSDASDTSSDDDDADMSSDDDSALSSSSESFDDHDLTTNDDLDVWMAERQSAVDAHVAAHGRKGVASHPLLRVPEPLHSDQLVRRHVLLPKAVYPDYPCDEHNGTGWSAVITRVSHCVVTVKCGSWHAAHFTLESVMSWLPLSHSSDKAVDAPTFVSKPLVASKPSECLLKHAYSYLV